MPYVESKTTIKGDGAKIYDIIKDMAAYPNFMHDLVSVEFWSVVRITLFLIG